MSDEGGADASRATYRARLGEELAALKAASTGSADARRPVELDQQSVGRLSRMDAMQRQAMAAAQDGRRKTRIAALKAALLRLDTDEFGFCTRCGEEIAARRLDTDPAITRCIECSRGA